MNLIEHELSSLDTPCLVLDMDLLDSNLSVMQEQVSQAGKQLRPHVKTHKCCALAKLQMERGASGLCVAKVSEAEGLVRSGLQQILITGPVVTPAKIRRLVTLLDAAPDLMAVVDSEQSIAELQMALAACNKRMNVLLDVDAGLNRTGVPPEQVLSFASKLRACDRLRLCGIQAYAGHLQHIKSYDERAEASRQSLGNAVEAFRHLRAENPDCTIFSASGTGTVSTDLSIPELSEVQPGSYVCMDTEYFQIGCSTNPAEFVDYAPALRLLTTVVSIRSDVCVTTDAGLKALYRDGGMPSIYGSNREIWAYDWFGDEYGCLHSKHPGHLPAIGSKVELVVSHCDPTINLFDRFHLVRQGSVTGEWAVDLRGCCQ